MADSDKVNALTLRITEEPGKVSEVRRFLGMTNHLRTILDLAEKSQISLGSQKFGLPTALDTILLFVPAHITLAA